MTFNEYRDLVKKGMEYNFYVNNNEFWISRNNEGYYLTRVKDSNTQAFLEADNLFENAIIDGEKIFHWWNQIKGYC